jgi:hypothetical protein
VDNAKLKALESFARQTLADAKRITDKAEAEGRVLTESEEHRLNSMLCEVDRVKPEILALREAAREAAGIRASGKTKGWDAVAKTLSKAHSKADGGRIGWEGKLKDVDVKGVTITDMLAESTKVEAGVRPLLEDSRRFHNLLPSSDPGNALHIDAFSIEARGLAGGSEAVERDPMSTGAKAVADLTIGIEEVDMRQFAVTSGAVPNQAFRSAPELSRILAAALGRELDEALDAHAVGALQASMPDVEASGSSLIEKLRHGKATLAARGVDGPFIAVIGDSDAAELDLMPADTLPHAFPFGISIAVVADALIDGNAYLMAANAIRKYRGAARLDVDPFSGFANNTSNTRLEYEALVTVVEPSAILDLVGIS